MRGVDAADFPAAGGLLFEVLTCVGALEVGEEGGLFVGFV